MTSHEVRDAFDDKVPPLSRSSENFKERLIDFAMVVYLVSLNV
jgi:hypothetical protein